MQTDDDRLMVAWAAARKGLIDWASVQRVQNELMPPCPNHPDRPAPIVMQSAAVCAECAIELLGGAGERKEQIVRALRAGAVLPDEAMEAWDNA